MIYRRANMDWKFEIALCESETGVLCAEFASSLITIYTVKDGSICNFT